MSPPGTDSHVHTAKVIDVDGRPELKRAEVEGYKSIARCEVDLSRLSFLIGRNGAGKSNFLDALRFIHDAVNTNLQSAATAHGGIGSFLRLRSAMTSFHLTLDLGPSRGSYFLKLNSSDRKTFEVTREDVWVGNPESETSLVASDVEPRPQRRTLALPAVAGANSDYGLLFEFLKSMRFYDFSLPALRELQTPQEGELLRADGSNLASVLARLESVDNERYERMQEYLRAILPGLKRVRRETTGPSEGIRFELDSGTFWARHMSTGTLLALAVLVALFQPSDASGQNASLITIEEPERALHPAAVGVLFDAMIEASHDRQVLVATQSPDLLDRRDVPAEFVLAVVGGSEGTQIGPIDPSARKAMLDHLFTAGELVRLDQLVPE